MTFFFALNSIWNVRALELHSTYACSLLHVYMHVPRIFQNFQSYSLISFNRCCCCHRLFVMKTSKKLYHHLQWVDTRHSTTTMTRRVKMVKCSVNWKVIQHCSTAWRRSGRHCDKEKKTRDREIHMKRCEMTTFSLSFAIVLVRDHFTHFHSVERHCRLSSSRHCTTEDSSILPTLCEFHFFSCPFVSHFEVTFRVNIDVFLISLRYSYLNRSWCSLEGVGDRRKIY